MAETGRGTFGKSDEFVKVKVILNYDLEEYRSKRVYRGILGDRKEARRKTRFLRGKVELQACSVSLIAFKNRKSDSATENLAENLDSSHWNTFLRRRTDGLSDFNFSFATPGKLFKLRILRVSFVFLFQNFENSRRKGRICFE